MGLSRGDEEVTQLPALLPVQTENQVGTDQSLVDSDMNDMIDY